MELFKIPIQLDTEDLLNLAVPEEIETEKLKDSLKKVSDLSLTRELTAYLWYQSLTNKYLFVDMYDLLNWSTIVWIRKLRSK